MERFPHPLGAWDGLRYFILALPEPYNYVVLVSCKNEEVTIKMKALEWSQHFSHCKSIKIFSDAQWQLTRQSMVGSGRISNSSETFLMVLVTCNNEEDPIKNEGFRMLTTIYGTLIFQMLKGR